MQYTLDSREQVLAGLHELYPSKKIKSKSALLTNDLTRLKEENEGVFYFGVLTLGNNIKATLNFEGLETIEVQKNSQIIELFSNISLTKDDGTPLIEVPKGFFRGFEITIS